jgi:hypothetical protein
MGIVFDARFNGKVDISIVSIFNEISFQKRRSFNDLVALVSKQNMNSLDWWVQGPASRNTYSSPFFHYFCTLHLLSHLDKNNKFTFQEIIVDSPAFKDVIEELLVDMGIGDCKVYCKLSFRGVIKNNLLMLGLFFIKFSQVLLARLILGKGSISHNEPLTLIDTFIMPEYVENDRWYGSLWDNLSASQRKTVYFVPTIVLTSLKKIPAMFKSAKNNSRNFIFKESYINYKDVLFAVRHKSRIKRIKIKPVTVLGCNISRLVEEELNNNSDMLTVVESILTYRFIRRISRLGVKTRLAIDWFEGQSLDKAWNLGFHEFYPQTKTIGYRAFEGFPFYLCAYPIPIEKKAGVLPHTIAVQGEATVSTVREFFPNLDVLVIPAFKAQYVWNQSADSLKKSEYIVLTTLPISVSLSSEIINRIANSYHLFNDTKKLVKFIIKPHPTHFIDNVKSCLLEWPERMLLSREKSLEKLLYSADVLITEASSTCLEALACGIPVIMMENINAITYDPIPKNIPNKMYKKIRTQQQLIDAIQYYISQIELGKIQQKVEGLKIRKKYFEPITSKGIDRLINANTQIKT